MARPRRRRRPIRRPDRLAGQCSRCPNPARVSHRYCCACQAAYMREWRRTHPLNPEQRRKANCRRYANTYQERGKLVPQPCEQCGSPKVEKHHSDYSKPLAVHWLCRDCHLQLHRAGESMRKAA